jgi:hypothetical protein
MTTYENLNRATKIRVRNWMTRFHEHYANATLLAEACGDDLGLAAPLTCVIPEDVYDLALAFFPEDNG